MRLDCSCHLHQLAVVAEQLAVMTFQDVCLAMRQDPKSPVHVHHAARYGNRLLAGMLAEALPQK